MPSLKSIADLLGMLVGLFIFGFCIGWLAGLSASPIVHIIIGGLMSLIAAVLSALASFKTLEKVDLNTWEYNLVRIAKRVRIMPLVLFIVGISVGAPFGITARTNDWYGIDKDKITQRWAVQDSHSVLTKEYIEKRLFDYLYLGPLSQELDVSPSLSVAKSPGLISSRTVLLSSSGELCDELFRFSGDDIDVEEVHGVVKGLKSQGEESPFLEGLMGCQNAVCISYMISQTCYE